MKKFMKSCAILALILIVAGLGMALVAGTIQGSVTFTQLMHSVHLDDDLGDEIMSKLENLEELNRLDSGVRFDIEDKLAFDGNNPSLSGNIKQTFAAEDVKSLDVEAGTCAFAIEVSEDEDFHVEVKNAGVYQGYVEDGTLNIKCIRKTSIGSGASDCAVKLLVPAGFAFEELELSLGAGQIKGSPALQAARMEIELGAGEVILDDLTAEELDIEVGAGSLEVTADILEKAEVKCAMGSVKMTIAGAQDDFNYKIEVAAGDVSIGSQSFSGLAQTRDINNDAPKKISVECAMGSVALDFTE